MKYGFPVSRNQRRKSGLATGLLLWECVMNGVDALSLLLSTFLRG